MRPQIKHATVVAYLALFVALAGGALAATTFVGPDGRIRACVSGNGQLTLLKVGKHCTHASAGVAWSQRGPAGPRGAKGDRGSPDNAAHATTADYASNAGNAGTLDNKDSSAFAPSGSEPWRTAVLNGDSYYCYWLRASNSFSEPGYYRDPGGTVHLRGHGKAADGSTFACGDWSTDWTIFYLPAGYRPDASMVFSTLSNNNPGRIDISADGKVAISKDYPTFADAKQWVSLYGLFFRCAPSGQNGCP